jgi:hypothetical protein
VSDGKSNAKARRVEMERKKNENRKKKTQPK